MEQQIRFLVESYYDMQKLRVEAFNRVVAWCCSQETSETQTKSASQSITENHPKIASQIKNENQRKIASHAGPETHSVCAKHADKPSILAHKIVTLKTEIPKEISELVWYHNSLHETEKQLAKRLNAWSKHHKLRLNYLEDVKGIGPILASGLIAWLQPIARFSNISKLWSYCGLSPTQKRQKGKKLNYNPRLKTLMWKIATSFEKQKAEKSQYRNLYETQKEYYNNREDLKKRVKAKEKGIKGYIRNLTLRYVVKRFLADLWLIWRKLDDLPISQPYVIAIQHHSDFEQPKTDIMEGL